MKKLIKWYLLILISTQFLMTLAYAGDWILVNTYQEKLSEKSSCSNYQYIINDLNSEKEAIESKMAFTSRNDVKLVSADIIPPHMSGILYQYVRYDNADKCEMKAVRVFQGPTVTEAEKKMTLHKKTYPEAILSEPNKIMIWPSRTLNSFTRDYQGVLISFISASNNSGAKTYLAKIRNTSASNVEVTFNLDGIYKVVKVGKDEIVNFPLGIIKGELDVQLKYGNSDENDSRTGKMID